MEVKKKKKSPSAPATKYFSARQLAVFKLFTFAVVEKLLCEDWYVKNSSVLAFCILLLIARDSEREGDELNGENIRLHRLPARACHLSSWAVGGWVIHFIPGLRRDTVIRFKKWGRKESFHQQGCQDIKGPEMAERMHHPSSFLNIIKCMLNPMSFEI